VIEAAAAAVLSVTIWIAAMAPVLVFAAAAGWLWRQMTGARSARWSRRYHEWFAPFGRLLVSDARAIARPVRAQRAAHGIDVDAELRDLFGG
jgi:hypothetical protein